METSDEFRVIPGYESYAVTCYGVVISIERNILLSSYILDNYLIVDTFRGSRTETLPVHRAVALAWVPNPDPSRYTIVNHKDGWSANNSHHNLEWTDYSGNNYHAVENGLRKDNIPCRVRDFYTKEIRHFPSMAQAAEFMGLRRDTQIEGLYPKMFGKLVADRFEFRFDTDPTPWFYEDRSELIPPSRFMVRVVEESEQAKQVMEIYSNRMFLKAYQLYDSPHGKSMPALAAYASQKYPDKRFEVRDAYEESRFRQTRATARSEPLPVRANRGMEEVHFKSLTECANHFDVDRSCIQSRLNNGKDIDGWTFVSQPLQPATAE